MYLKLIEETKFYAAKGKNKSKELNNPVTRAEQMSFEVKEHSGFKRTLLQGRCVRATRFSLMLLTQTTM